MTYGEKIDAILSNINTYFRKWLVDLDETQGVIIEKLDTIIEHLEAMKGNQAKAECSCTTNDEVEIYTLQGD